jgi:hypothetical protein
VTSAGEGLVEQAGAAAGTMHNDDDKTIDPVPVAALVLSIHPPR